jgi:4-carboxymuconolactone decarboxylase
VAKKISKHKVSSRFRAGLAIRRAVVGDAYVDRALAAADELTWPLQELVTEYCWGAVWTRPQLSRRERSLLNLGMLTALNRPHEIRTHIVGALNNGLTRAEIVEAFLQAGVYCGVPAAVDSVRIAQAVFAELDAGAPAERKS